MTSQGPLPELVRDTRLHAEVQGKITVHRRLVRRRGAPQEERWIRYENSIIGGGGSGVVWLEHKVKQAAEDLDECRAVKGIRMSGDSTIRYVRELEALAKFSQERVSGHPPHGVLMHMRLIPGCVESIPNSSSSFSAGTTSQTTYAFRWSTARMET